MPARSVVFQYIPARSAVNLFQHEPERMDDAELVSAFLAATSNMSDQERATLAGVTHTTVGRWRRGDWKGVRPGTKRKLLGVLERSGAREERETDEVGDWVEHALGMTRRAGGAGGEDDEETRRIKADILAGCIKLARKEGRDRAGIARLEDELAKLGGSPAIQTRPTAEGLLDLLHRESRMADKRTTAAVDLAAALRIEAEETKERRVQAVTLHRPEPGYAFSELTPDERAALELVEREERGARKVTPTSPPPAPESRAEGPTGKDQPPA